MYYFCRNSFRMNKKIRNNLGEVTYKELLVAAKSNKKIIRNKKQEINNLSKSKDEINNLFDTII